LALGGARCGGEAHHRRARRERHLVANNVPSNARSLVREFVECYGANVPIPIDIAKPRDKKAASLSSHCTRVCFYLVIQSLMKVTGEDGFLRDCQSLLFNTSVHSVVSRGNVDDSGNREK
jgi:hypothetical protein